MMSKARGEEDGLLENSRSLNTEGDFGYVLRQKPHQSADNAADSLAHNQTLENTLEDFYACDATSRSATPSLQLHQAVVQQTIVQQEGTIASERRPNSATKSEPSASQLDVVVPQVVIQQEVKPFSGQLTTTITTVMSQPEDVSHSLTSVLLDPAKEVVGRAMEATHILNVEVGKIQRLSEPIVDTPFEPHHFEMEKLSPVPKTPRSPRISPRFGKLRNLDIQVETQPANQDFFSDRRHAPAKPKSPRTPRLCKEAVTPQLNPPSPPPASPNKRKLRENDAVETEEAQVSSTERDIPEFANSAEMKRRNFKRRRKNFTLRDYLQSELLGVQDLGLAEAFRHERVQNFFHVPMRFEKLIILGLFISLDCFLYVFTFLPIRIVLAWAKMAGTVIFPRTRWFSFHRNHGYDLMRGLIVLIVCYSLDYVEMSRVYHYIRGQAMIKLYVLSAMIEIFDKLGSSLGQDILDGLYWTARLEPFAKKLSVHFAVATIFVLLHAMLLFCQLVTLNVAINSSNTALLTLLISNNFAELKTVVFKKFEEQNLFQISCSDVVERFKLILFLGLIILQTATGEAQAEYIGQTIQGSALVILSELCVDWIKHAFISKFNRIDPDVYDKYAIVLTRDLTLCRKENVILDHTHAVARRLGLVSLPLACVVLKMCYLSMKALLIDPCSLVGALLIALIFACLLALKVLNSILLMSHACRYGFILPDMEGPRTEAATQRFGDLTSVERYTFYDAGIM